MRTKVANSLIYSAKNSLELDSHVDTKVLGKVCLVVHDFDRSVNVIGYKSEYGSKVCWNMKFVLAYDHPQTSKPYLLVINQATHFDHLEHHLMCPMQFRTNGININDTPNYLSKSPYESTNALKVEDMSDEEGGMITTPFQLSGVTSKFPVLKPTKQAVVG